MDAVLATIVVGGRGMLYKKEVDKKILITTLI
jgi:hypothetical protein